MRPTMTISALAHVAATPHLHGELADAALAILFVAVIALTPRLFREIRRTLRRV